MTEPAYGKPSKHPKPSKKENTPGPTNSTSISVHIKRNLIASAYVMYISTYSSKRISIQNPHSTGQFKQLPAIKGQSLLKSY